MQVRSQDSEQEAFYLKRFKDDPLGLAGEKIQQSGKETNSPLFVTFVFGCNPYLHICSLQMIHLMRGSTVWEPFIDHRRACAHALATAAATIDTPY